MIIYVHCPYCNGMIEIVSINCAIFRHGINKKNNTQIDPHSSKQICNDLINNNSIYGCGKPFKLININNEYLAIKCDYI